MDDRGSDHLIHVDPGLRTASREPQPYPSMVELALDQILRALVGSSAGAGACPAGTRGHAGGRTDGVTGLLDASFDTRPAELDLGPHGAGASSGRGERVAPHSAPAGAESVAAKDVAPPEAVPSEGDRQDGRTPGRSSNSSTPESSNPTREVAVLDPECLDSMRPGPDLVAVLDALDPSALDSRARVEVVAAWERVMAWAAACQARFVGALAAEENSSRHLRAVGDEIASRLSITRVAAEMKIALSDSLAQFAGLRALLAEGRLDTTKVRILGDEVVHLPRHAQHAVLEGVLPDAPVLTGPQVRNAVRKAVMSTDPTTAERRAKRERSERCVTLTHAPDAMAWFAAHLPADAAMTCFTAVDALAAAAAPRGRAQDRCPARRRTDGRPPRDPRQRVGAVRSSPDPAAAATPHPVTVGAGSLLGIDDAPAELAGYGPIPAGMARSIAQDGTWRRIVVDEQGVVCSRGDATYRPGADLTGTVVARDATCTFPGCRVPAWRCDLDHVVPFDAARPAREQTTTDNLQALCRHDHRLKTEAGWGAVRDASSGVTRWTAAGLPVRAGAPPAPGPAARPFGGEDTRNRRPFAGDD